MIKRIVPRKGEGLHEGLQEKGVGGARGMAPGKEAGRGETRAGGGGDFFRQSCGSRKLFAQQIS